jgi:hypothetical protein
VRCWRSTAPKHGHATAASPGWAAPGGEGKRRLAAVTAEQAAAAAAANAAWLEDCAIRLMCVLALDRFGDYVSDQARALPNRVEYPIVHVPGPGARARARGAGVCLLFVCFCPKPITLCVV